MVWFPTTINQNSATFTENTYSLLTEAKRDDTQKETQVAGMKTKRTQRRTQIFQGSKLGFLLLLRLKIYGK